MRTQKEFAFFSTLTLALSVFTGITVAQQYTMAKVTDMHKIENVDVFEKKSNDCDSIKNQWFWDFNKWNDTEGWTLPDPVKGEISGGTICFSVRPGNKKPHSGSWSYQVWGDDTAYDILSPGGLSIPAQKYNLIQMRIRNLSPETDGNIFWKTADNLEKDAGQAKFTMKPDEQEWQIVSCYLNNNWTGVIDQIRIRPAQMRMRGNIWIDWIKVTQGKPKEKKLRPDLCSENVVPKIVIPGITQDDFHEAFKILDECLVTDIPMKGFNYPYIAPGGKYGHSWWQLDGSLNIAGAKWVNQELAEGIIRGFAGVQEQNPDGRIDLWGGSPMRGMPANVSSLPRFFEAAFDVAIRTKDPELRQLIFNSMKDYLSYWFSSAKKDSKSGLITAVFEESFSDENFGDKNAKPGTLAPVDLNVAVAVGCYNISQLAKYLDQNEDAIKYSEMFKQLCHSINTYLWNEEKNAYYNFDIGSFTQKNRLICTTFAPMRYGIAPQERIEKMLPVLLNPKNFNWGIRPVTSIAMTDPDFMEATGSYDGTAWFGDVWTMRNMLIIAGLEDSGKHDLAAELTWKTIKIFNNNYSEYIVPSNGSGEGEERYGWSASQYIQAIIEHLFGVTYNQIEKRLNISPHIPQELSEKTISLRNLLLPFSNNTRLNLIIDSKSEDKLYMDIEITGDLPEGSIHMMLPKSTGKEFKLLNHEYKETTSLIKIENKRNLMEVAIPMQKHVKLIFR